MKEKTDCVVVKIAALDNNICNAANNEMNYYRIIELMDGEDWHAIVNGSVIWETNEKEFCKELAELLHVDINDVMPTNTPWNRIWQDIAECGFKDWYYNSEKKIKDYEAYEAENGYEWK